MINVVFFAALREQLSCANLSLETDQTQSIEQVKHTLIELHPEWKVHLENASLLYAVNNDMVNSEHIVTSGDEVAFFPPVTGG